MLKIVLQAIRKFKQGDKFYILAPLKFSKNRKTTEEINILIQKGFSRIYDYEHKKILSLEELINDQKWKMTSSTFLLIDRMVAKDFDEDEENRLADSISLAFYEGEGSLQLLKNEETLFPFSNKFELDGILFEEPVHEFVFIQQPLWCMSSL